MVSIADLKGEADKRRVDLNNVPEELFVWPTTIRDVWSKLATGRTFGVGEDREFRRMFGYVHRSDFPEEIRANIGMDNLPANLFAVDELIRSGNEPTLRTRMEKKVSWIYPRIRHLLKDDGTVEENEFGKKYGLIELVHPKEIPGLGYVFLGKYSIAALEALSKAYPPKDLNKLLAAYLDKRVQVYTKSDGTPRKGQADRIELLTDVKENLSK